MTYKSDTSGLITWLL